jgi:Flp pilus assembly pilin Flp
VIHDHGTVIAVWSGSHNDCVARRDASEEVPVTCIALLVNALRRKNEGQDLLEYALLIALIALVAVAAVTGAGQSVDEIFERIVSALPA